jgi:Na+-driven multidrug efflux pump
LAHPLNLGVAGLLWGLFIGLVGASGLLAWRFRVLTGREVRPF